VRHAHLDDPPEGPRAPRPASPRGGAAQPRVGDHADRRAEPDRHATGDDGGRRHRHRGVRHLSHKPDRIRALVEAAGCLLVFLPAYSPDLSPVEKAFSKLKALIRAAAARTRAALDAAIAAALAAITAADAAGWFAHAGYTTPQAA
jgi:transposase